MGAHARGTAARFRFLWHGCAVQRATHPATGPAIDPPVGPTVAVVSAGGVLGALARYATTAAWPVPWATVAVNLLGCLVIGCLLVLVTERRRGHPLARPFLGTGVLGGFTTFSAFSADAGRLVASGETGAAALYVVSTVVGSLLAVSVGAGVTRRLA